MRQAKRGTRRTAEGPANDSASPRAVLDVGSNTIRLLVALPTDGGIKPLLSKGRFVRLGQGVHSTGALCPERAELAVRAIDRLARDASSAGASEVIAVATAAVREARDGRAFVRDVERRTGVQLEVLSGDREGQLTFVGATLGLPVEGEAIVVDLGGNSTEIVAGTAKRVLWARSLPVGSGRLTEQFVRTDPPRRRELRAAGDHVAELLETLPTSAPGMLVFTGGTARHVAHIVGERDTVVRVRPAELDRVARLLRDRPAGRLANRLGVRLERAQMLPAGVEALRRVAACYSLDEIILTRQGIREALIVDGARRLAS